MSLSEYAQKLLALRAEFRSSNRRLAFLIEVGRYASVMALVLTVADLSTLTTFAAVPRKRLVFIVGWALLMAAVEAVRPHAKAPQASK